MGKPDALLCWADNGMGAGDNDNIVLLRPELFASWALEGLVIQVKEVSILADIWKGNLEGLHEDVVARAAVMLKAGQQMWTCSVHSQEWWLDQGILTFWGCIYVPNDPELRQWIVEQYYNLNVMGHPRHWKTLELVSNNYWWL